MQKSAGFGEFGGVNASGLSNVQMFTLFPFHTRQEHHS